MSRLKIGKTKSVKTRKFYRDGLEEEIVGPIEIKITHEGHTVEIYTTSDGKTKFFATLAGSHWCAHGSSIADAIGSAIWKDPERRPSMESVVADIQKEGVGRKITLDEFRLLTGACLEGCRTALRQAGRDESPMTAHEVRDIVSREWGDKLLCVLGWTEETS